MSIATDANLRVASTLIVTLKDGVLSVPVPGEFPIVVDLPQLLLLEGLTGAAPRPVAPIVRDVARRTRMSEADLTPWVQHLCAHGYLLPAPARAAFRRPTEAAAAPLQLEGKTVVVPSPRSAMVADGSFAMWDHAGRGGVSLSAVELFALRALTEARTLVDAHAAHAQMAGDAALSPAALAALVTRLCAAGFAVLSADRAPAPQIFGIDGSLAATLSDQARRLRAVFTVPRRRAGRPRGGACRANGAGAAAV